MHNVGNRPSRHDLSQHGIDHVETVHWNLNPAQLVEKALRRHEGLLANGGSLVVRTGQFTGRSPKDKYIVRDAETDSKVDWGPVNQPMTAESFNELYQRMLKFWEGSEEVFVQDCFGGADHEYTLPIRVISQRAWHSLFARQLFLRPAAHHDTEAHIPEFTIFFAPTFYADPEKDGTRSKTCIAVDFSRRAVIIAGTEYAGEVKKSVFTILNYLLPLRGVMPMHCSANIGDNGHTALFFGLSGTGKTTLSADPQRSLIGDDEHGWSDHGIFNFEGGCYAKCIKLSKEKEPQIWNAIRFGTVLENVVLDLNQRTLDFDSDELTENTRAAYPIDFIDNALVPSVGSHPSHILFLTADAFGVLPPISRLTPEQAMFHFLSGYTAKLAGTERGLGKEPSATFSACFGAPFLPLPAVTYAKMLGEKMRRHGVKCYLVNTGWVGGPYGVGERMNLPYTRAMVNAAVQGQLDSVATEVHPVFRVAVPRSCPGVPDSVLNARGQWSDGEAYDRAATHLDELFRNNLTKFGAAAEELVEMPALAKAQ
jgi:phosphoenolpyruvate carboxykinase (ATP)